MKVQYRRPLFFHIVHAHPSTSCKILSACKPSLSIKQYKITSTDIIRVICKSHPLLNKRIACFSPGRDLLPLGPLPSSSHGYNNNNRPQCPPQTSTVQIHCPQTAGQAPFVLGAWTEGHHPWLLGTVIVHQLPGSVCRSCWVGGTWETKVLQIQFR